MRAASTWRRPGFSPPPKHLPRARRAAHRGRDSNQVPAAPAAGSPSSTRRSRRTSCAWPKAWAAASRWAPSPTPLASARALAPGSHSTFGGSPLACAAGLAALETYRSEGLIERSDTLGHGCSRTCAPWPTRPVVRGCAASGLMLAIELRTRSGPSLMLGIGSSRCRPVRPSSAAATLVITDEEMALGVQAIVAALKSASAQAARRPSAAASS